MAKDEKLKFGLLFYLLKCNFLKFPFKILKLTPLGPTLAPAKIWVKKLHL
jgi:hypothetical protein